MRPIDVALSDMLQHNGMWRIHTAQEIKAEIPVEPVTTQH